jgi:hypothetical protein
MISRFLFVLACALLAAAPLEAATIVDTGPGQLTPSQALPVQSYTFGQFTIGKNSYITSVEFFGAASTGGTGRLVIVDNQMNKPGTQFLFDDDVRVAASNAGAWHGITSIGLNDGKGAYLSAGTYWVGLFNNGLFPLTHFGGAATPLGREVFREVGLPDVSIDSLNLAWRINGTEALDTPVSNVPEPASWAMMLLGFGAIGVALRRRRRKLLPLTSAA